MCHCACAAGVWGDGVEDDDAIGDGGREEEREEESDAAAACYYDGEAWRWVFVHGTPDVDGYDIGCDRFSGRTFGGI